MEKKKRLIIIGGSIFVLSLTLGISLSLRNKPQNIKLEDLQKNKAIAFYKLKEDGTYEETNIMPTTGYKLNEEKSVCSNGAKPSLNTSDYSLNLTNLKGHTNCYLYFDEIFGSAAKDVLGDITSKTEKTEFTGIATAADTGIYSAPDDYGTSYYFRGLGGSLNNWVKFAGSYWRIIRVNGNGTIRMIYSGAANGAVSSSNKTGETTQIGTSMYNHTVNDNAYVGYMMGIPLNGTAQTVNTTSNHSTSYDQAHTNTYDSDAKIQIDNWYRTNIEDKGLSKYIDVNTGFCNDRKIAKVSRNNFNNLGYGANSTAYAGADRTTDASWNILSTQTPTLQCENKTNDLFTAKSSSVGNKSLIYPVGMVTIDEVIFAGGFYSTNNSTFYLYTNERYWTMSPFNYESSYAHIFYVYSGGNLNGEGVNATYGLRPVINLRADTKFTYNSESTKGSESDPFIVS